MRHLKTLLLLGVLLLGGGKGAFASSILDGWAVNIDGVFYSFSQYPSPPASSLPGESLPAGVSISTDGLNFGTIDVLGGGGQVGDGTGIGTMAVSILGSGTHSVTFWMDAHITNPDDPFYWGDYGAQFGDPTGYSWM